MPSNKELAAEIVALKASLAEAIKATTDDRVKALTGDIETLTANAVEFEAEKETLTSRVAELDTENFNLLNSSDDEAVEKLTTKVTELEGQIVEMRKQPAAVNIKGFSLGHTDPFAAGALRTYLKTTKTRQQQAPVLPFVLPSSDPASTVALKSYIVRAGGAGDTERVKAATAALPKAKG